MNTRTISVPIRVEGDLEAMITPVTGPALDTALQQAICGPNTGVFRYTGGKRPLRMYVAPRRTAIVEFNDVAVGFVAEVLRDDEVILTDHTWWMGGSGVPDIGFGSWSDDPGLDTLLDEDFTSGNWTVRVMSDPSLAIRAGEAKNYWQGEFTIPLRFREVGSLAPEPHWWQEEEDRTESDEEPVEEIASNQE